MNELNKTIENKSHSVPTLNITQNLDWDKKIYYNIQFKSIWNVCTQKEKVSQKDVFHFKELHRKISSFHQMVHLPNLTSPNSDPL